MVTRLMAPPSPVGGCGWGFAVDVVGGGSPVWLGLGGMKRHDLRSSRASCGCGWVGVSQREELRKSFLSLRGSGMREGIYMIKQNYV